MKVMFAPVAKEYEKAMLSAKTEDILSAINAEEKIYFELLASHYDDCTLFFSRSDGSSVETMLNDLMEHKNTANCRFLFPCLREKAKRRRYPSYYGGAVLAFPSAAG